MKAGEKGGASLNKAEGKEVVATLTEDEYDRLNAIHTRIMDATDDLGLLIPMPNSEKGTKVAWETLRNAKKIIDLGIDIIEKIAYRGVQ